MNATLLYIILALAAGLGLPTQAGINAQLGLWTRSPISAALISFAVGTVGLALYVLVFRVPALTLATAGTQPWWIWSGGLIGAFFVAAATIIAPKLGATTMLALILAGQLVASVIFDHFGLLGYPVHPLTPGRLFGIALLVAGAALVRNS